MRHRVRQIELPESARALSTLSSIDYSDAFLVEAGAERTALGWARTILEDAPASFRAAAPWAWLAIGLEHDRARSEDAVLGWPIRRATPDVALLGADSRFGMPAELLVERRPPGLLFATLIRLENRAMRAVWAAITPGHQRIVRQLLERASRAESVTQPAGR